MTKDRGAFGRADVVALLTVPVILAGIVAAALAEATSKDKLRISGRSLNGISVAQQNFATTENLRGKPETFVRGTEAFCQPGGKALPDFEQSTDGSRAFVYLVKKGYFPSLEYFASPADPFVAVLSATAKELKETDTDFPAEGKPVASGAWAKPDSPAAKDAGHTFFSYSMTAGNADKFCNLQVRMYANMPLASDRNPYGEIFKELAKEEVTKNSESGNSWNNNREGVMYSMRDGSTRYLKSATELEIAPPVRPDPKLDPTIGKDDRKEATKDEGPAFNSKYAPPPPLPGYDYFYSDEPLTEKPGKPANGKNVKPGEAGTAKNRGCWMID